MCGEKLARHQRRGYPTGSSPRVRGEVFASGASVDNEGIIPACAGRRRLFPLTRFVKPDHPRVCGEKTSTTKPPSAPMGSSPRVRGEASLPSFPFNALRIIPACAGRSSEEKSVMFEEKDHPRVCGEKTRAMGVLERMKGSSPRVRGEAASISLGDGPDRIIPACAGRNPHGIPHFLLDGDHPRVCGEKPTKTTWRLPWPGSSPRVRGEAGYEEAVFAFRGIIPACAGRRSSTNARRPSTKDHPRVCGEKAARSVRPPSAPGSSPRVRGEGC